MVSPVDCVFMRVVIMAGFVGFDGLFSCLGVCISVFFCLDV